MAFANHAGTEFMTPRLRTLFPSGSASPLVPAAGCFLVGAAVGWNIAMPPAALLEMAGAAWMFWAILEIFGQGAGSRWALQFGANLALALTIFCCGALLVSLNQRAAENAQVARLAPERGEVMVACRAEVVVAPSNSEQIGNAYWTARVREIWTDRGWIDATGDVLVKWAGGRNAAMLHRGAVVEMEGWLSRPLPALNPGAINPRKMLAADRVFAQMRVPRAGGVTVLLAADSRPPGVLSRVRLFLRGKLLEHTIQQDVPAAYTITALLLGYRDPAIGDISRAFSDAGVAHLLAISGTHVVFFTAAVWAVLRFLPVRPRWRELLIGGIVIAYVLATPCGPPIVRAAVGVLAVLLARMMGRSPQHLNTLALAVIAVVLIRPADIVDAGFQLTFVTTAALVLLSERLHAAVFARWLARQALVAELGRGFWQRLRHRVGQVLAAVVVGNGIGAVAAAPLVAIHFGQVNLWGMATGFVVLPLVSAAMVMGMVQLLAEMLWSGLAAALSGVTAHVGQGLIWVIEALAALPGAAVSVRPMPAWLVALPYACLLLWSVRRRIGVSRAAVVNATVACLVCICAWYVLGAPRGETQLTVLSAGTGSNLLLRTPGGQVWAINAGRAQGTDVLASAWRPAMRLAGTRRLDGAMVTSLDVAHAGQAAETAMAFSPRTLWTSASLWAVRGQSLAGAQIAEAASSRRIVVKSLERGEGLDLGGGLRAAVLWPPQEGAKPALSRKDLIVMLEFQERRVLVVDPAAGDALAMVMLNEPGLRCDAIVFTGPVRGEGDLPLRRIVAPLGAQKIIWTGRGSWAPRQRSGGELNAADGAVEITIRNGGLAVSAD